ncbi:MAG: arylsulfotransferase family protein [Pseudomonadota bacterium]
MPYGFPTISPTVYCRGVLLAAALTTSIGCQLSVDQIDSDTATTITASVRDAASIYPGYLLWHRSDELKQDVDNATILADASGNVIHVWPSTLTGGGTPAYLLPDGMLARTGTKDIPYARLGPVASVDTLQIVGKDGNVVWEASARAMGELYFHHDFEPLPNGNILVTTYRAIPAAEALALGWDPLGAEQVWTDGVFEIKPDLATGGASVIWSWEVVDHLIQDKFPDRSNYGVVADHPDRIDPNFPTNYAPRNTVRQHINSVDYNAELGQILISSFIYNEIWIVDRNTTRRQARGERGGLLYRYGNPAAYDHGSADSRVFLKQHDANWIDPGLPGAGNVLVHNNNTELQLRRPNDGIVDESPVLNNKGSSEVVELSLPLSADGTYDRDADAPYAADTVWRWQSPEYFADFQGGARRLPNGSTLLTDTTDHLVVELTTDSSISVTYSSDAPVYKAFKYSRAEVAPLIDD